MHVRWNVASTQLMHTSNSTSTVVLTSMSTSSQIVPEKVVRVLLKVLTRVPLKELTDTSTFDVQVQM